MIRIRPTVNASIVAYILPAVMHHCMHVKMYGINACITFCTLLVYLSDIVELPCTQGVNNTTHIRTHFAAK